MADPFESWLAAVPDDEGPLADAVITFLRETLPGADESIKWNNPCFELAGSKVCYVSAQSGYVNLGFYEGAALDDEDGLLEGTGTAMRHVKVRTDSDLEDPALRDLVSAAAAHARG